MSVLFLCLCFIGVYLAEAEVDSSNLNLEQCEQKLCEFEKELLTLKTLIANQNTQIAEQNVLIERQNTRIANQNIRIIEETNKSDQLRSQAADLEEKMKQQGRDIENLKEFGDKDDCPNGWLRHVDTCYLVVDNITRTWDDAAEACERYGGELAVIRGESTNNFLKEISRQSKGNYFWLGANDRSQEGTWVWVKSGTVVDFVDWNRSQPDNGGGNQNCMALYRNYKFRWDDGRCSSSQNFICQK